MKYLCLAYEEENKLSLLTKTEWDKLRGETLSYLEDLRNRGHIISAEALQSTRTASTVRVRSGRVSVTDGPFAETKEQISGYYIVEAKDLDEAAAIASRIPSARTGGIEVRPLRKM